MVSLVEYIVSFLNFVLGDCGIRRPRKATEKSFAMFTHREIVYGMEETSDDTMSRTERWRFSWSRVGSLAAWMVMARYGFAGGQGGKCKVIDGRNTNDTHCSVTDF